MDTVDTHITYLGKNNQTITISHTPRATQSWYHDHVSHLFHPKSDASRASFAWWEHRELGNEMWPQNLGDWVLPLFDLGQYNSKTFQRYLERLQLYKPKTWNQQEKINWKSAGKNQLKPVVSMSFIVNARGYVDARKDEKHAYDAFTCWLKKYVLKTSRSHLHTMFP